MLDLTSPRKASACRTPPQLITELHVLALANFTPESVERANNQRGGDRTLTILVGIAMARAAELKTVLMEMQVVAGPAWPASHQRGVGLPGVLVSVQKTTQFALSFGKHADELNAVSELRVARDYNSTRAHLVLVEP